MEEVEEEARPRHPRCRSPPFCSIVESQSFINPPLHESNSTERLDATTANHFNRIHDTSGPRNNPFIFNNTDLYAVDEVWLHRASAAVVRASVHPANRVNTTDGLASAWSFRFRRFRQVVGRPRQGQRERRERRGRWQAAARMVPQLMTVGSATTEVFACAGGRTEDNTGRTTWLLEVTPPATATSATNPGVTVMSIQDVISGTITLCEHPEPLHGPTLRRRTCTGPAMPRTTALQCAMTQVGDNVATRELHMIALYNGVLYHSMASNFSTPTSDPNGNFKRFASISPWASVTQALGGTFSNVVSAIVASRQSADQRVLRREGRGADTAHKNYHAVRFSANGGSWRPVDDVLALREGAGAIPGFTAFNVAAGMCPAYPETPADTGDEIV